MSKKKKEVKTSILRYTIVVLYLHSMTHFMFFYYNKKSDGLTHWKTYY